MYRFKFRLALTMVIIQFGILALLFVAITGLENTQPSYAAATSTAKAWGANINGELGDGSTVLRNTPVAVNNLPANVTQIVAGSRFSLARTADGNVWFWGPTSDRHLLPSVANIPNNGKGPVQIPNISGVKQLAAGNGFIMALKDDGTLLSWGDNLTGSATGVLGRGVLHDFGSSPTYFDTGTNVAEAVIGLSGVQNVVSNYDHTLALTQSGSLVAWGGNSAGQLGADTRPAYSGATTSWADYDVPVGVVPNEDGTKSVIGIAAGSAHSLAIFSDGTVVAWGDNGNGALAQPSNVYRSLKPLTITGLSDVVQVAAGDGFSLALKSNGDVYAWGSNSFGALGINSSDSNLTQRTPIKITTLANIKEIVAAGSHALARDNSGNIWVWGDNREGQLGIGSSSQSILPAKLSGITGATQIATSTHHSLALFGDLTPPSTPVGLTSTTKTASSITLSWNASTDNVGVTGYEIYKGATLAGSSTTTSFNVTGLTANTNYTFTVKAKDAAGNVSVASETFSTSTTPPADTQAPTVPGNFQSPAKTTTSVSLSWTASSDNIGVVGYEIYQNSSTTPVGISGANATSYVVTGLTPSSAYTFTVKASDAAGNKSNASTSLSITTNSDGHRTLSGDFDGDGKKDLLVIDSVPANAKFAFTHYTLRVAQKLTDSSTVTYNSTDTDWGWGNQEERKFFAGDFDGDGKSDVLIMFKSGPYSGVNYDHHAFSVYRSNGDGTFSTYSRTDTVWGWGDSTIRRFFVGDFDGDGKRADVMLAFLSGPFGQVTYNHTALSFYRSDGNGIFTGQARTETTWVWSADPNQQQLLSGDFNGDGKTDIVQVSKSGSNIVNYDHHVLSAYYSNGNGIFTLFGTTDTVWGWGDNTVRRFFVGDFDGDGKSDVMLDYDAIASYV